MPDTVRAADESLPKDDRADDAALDQFNIINDANLLHHLIDAIDDTLTLNGCGFQELNRACALVTIACNLSEQLSVDVAAIFEPREMKPWAGGGQS